MDIIYKRLTENELDTFIQMRINQLHEEGATEELTWFLIWRITIIGIWQMEHLSHGLQRMGIRL